MYVIKDEESGNFVSKNSIYVDDGVLYYSTFTGGHFGLDYYPKDKALSVISKLKLFLDKYKIHKNLKLFDVGEENIPEGERKVITYLI